MFGEMLGTAALSLGVFTAVFWLNLGRCDDITENEDLRVSMRSGEIWSVLSGTPKETTPDNIAEVLSCRLIAVI